MKKLIIYLFVLLLLTGCSSTSTSSYKYEDADMVSNGEYYESPALGIDYEYGEKVIVTGNLNIDSSDMEKTIENIKSVIEKYNSYIISSGESNYNNYHSCNYSIRIPKDNFNDFVNDLKELDNVTSFNTDSDDITDTYIDYESRLNNLKAEEGRLIELYDIAETVSDVISIESQLTSVRSDIEYYETTLKNFDTKIAYSTLDIYASSNVGNNTSSFSSRIGNAISNMFGNFLNSLENILIFIIYAIPYLLVIGIIVVVIIVIKKRKNKKEQ